MKKAVSSHEILKDFFERKRALRSHFSLRYLAKRLNLSPSFISRVFNGSKRLPLKHLAKVAKELEIDAPALRQLRKAFAKEYMFDFDETEPSAHKPNAPSDRFVTASADAFSILDRWYLLPILELVTCVDFQDDPAWIGRKLKISPTAVQGAWLDLIKSGCLKKENGRWVKTQRKIRFPSTRSSSQIQKYHSKMLEKAKFQVENRSSQEAFERRLILGASVATNAEGFEKAQKYLEQALFEALNIMTSGKADKIYHLGLQLFPLSHDD